MKSGLLYAVSQLAGSDATVLSNYTPALSSPDDESVVVSRREPPREKIRVGAEYAHLVSTAEQIVALMGDSPRSPSREVVRLVVRFLNRHGKTVRPPAVSSTSEGGIQLEWFRDNRGVELEFDREGELVVLIDQNGEVTSEVVRDLNDVALLTALRLIRRD